jgi:hypothetical protein
MSTDQLYIDNVAVNKAGGRIIHGQVAYEESLTGGTLVVPVIIDATDTKDVGTLFQEFKRDFSKRDVSARFFFNENDEPLINIFPGDGVSFDIESIVTFSNTETHSRQSVGANIIVSWQKSADAPGGTAPPDTPIVEGQTGSWTIITMFNAAAVVTRTMSITFAPIFREGVEGTIVSVSDNDGSARLHITGLQIEARRNFTVQVSGTANYNGVYTVSEQTENTITIPVPFVGDDSGLATLSFTQEAEEAYRIGRDTILSRLGVGANGARSDDTGLALTEERVERHDEMVTVFLAADWMHASGLHPSIVKITPAWASSTPEEWPLNAGIRPTVYSAVADVTLNKELSEEDNPADMLTEITASVIAYLREILPAEVLGPAQVDVDGEVITGRLTFKATFLGGNSEIRARGESTTVRKDLKYKAWWGGKAHYIQTSDEPDPKIVAKTVVQTHRVGTIIEITPPQEQGFIFVEVGDAEQESDPAHLNNVGQFVTEERTKTYVRYKSPAGAADPMIRLRN